MLCSKLNRPMSENKVLQSCDSTCLQKGLSLPTVRNKVKSVQLAFEPVKLRVSPTRDTWGLPVLPRLSSTYAFHVPISQIHLYELKQNGCLQFNNTVHFKLFKNNLKAKELTVSEVVLKSPSPHTYPPTLLTSYSNVSCCTSGKNWHLYDVVLYAP